jgi:hypothetical protein
MNEPQRLFVIAVAMTVDGSRADLLQMASVLHRRGVEIVEADLSRSAHGRRVFSATFHAAERQAETVLRTMEGLVDVIDASLFNALDARGDLHRRLTPPSSTTVRTDLDLTPSRRSKD